MMASYYASFDDTGVQRSFQDMDDPANLEGLMRKVQSSVSKNLVVDFSDATSFAAFDLPNPSVTALLNANVRESYVRWINIWYPYQSRSLIEILARRYDFSPRLLALMCSDPYQTRRSPSSQQVEPYKSRSFWRRSSPRTSSESEVEKGMDELSEHSSISSYDSIARGNLYRIVDDIWHYSSVDLGRNYLCIGYNSLYGTKHTGGECGEGLLPYCTRVWTWLILCDDQTLISINEDPFPYSDGRLDHLQLRILRETRRNLVNVFRSLSKVEENTLLAQNPMTVLPIRIRLGDTPEETVHRETDAPGLLLYYLFENWQNSYTLVTRKESRYGIELGNLRAQMFQTPQLHHIDRLDTIGKELGVLKKHYQSYNRIIDRLVEPQIATSASLQNSHVVSEASQTSFDTVRPLVTEKQSMLGVSLSSAARVRFKRLRDLIDLYALSEVEEYIKQKDSLITMNFNLIAMKESIDMERLTRVTLLITKATILFLPVSLMSAYFSAQLSNVEYTVQDYWVSFAVILFASWIALFVFGVFSGSVQTMEVLRALGRGLKRVGGSMARVWKK
jgi:Mg2+ and Co2+ transporter CorA